MTERERFEAWLSAQREAAPLQSPTLFEAWCAALSAPPGFVLVPVEPTPEMVDAIPYPLSVTPNTGIQCYRSMCAAAPSAKETTHV